MSTAPLPQDEHLTALLDAGVLTVTMNNPTRRNALTDSSLATLVAAVERAQNDEEVRALLITGEGDDFCSGFDIVARNAGSKDTPRPRVGAIQRRLPSQAHRLVPLLLEVQVPVVSAVKGYAAGIGLQVALASDFVVAADDATFWEPFSQRGMTPDAGATWLLPRVVGPLRARELLLLGRRLSGKEAQDWGIVHEAVGSAEVAARAQELAARLASGPTVALGLTRWLINTGADRSIEEHVAQEAFAMELSSRSLDFREGLKAFVEKRDPDFTGK